MQITVKAEDFKSKKISITLGDLVDSRLSLIKLLNADLPVKIAWTLRGSAQAVEQNLKRFDEQRNVLIKKYAGTTNSVPPEKMDVFITDMNVLREIKVDLEVTPVSVDILGDTVKLSAIDAMRLQPFLTEIQQKGNAKTALAKEKP